MMETVPVLRLNQQQVEQLMAHCTAYRTYLWQHLLPSSERNQSLRVIQALQGRLLTSSQKHAQAEIALSLSAEEGTILKHLFSVLMKLCETEAASEKCTHMLAEMAALRLLLERVSRRTHV
jgi:hypothetical protein